MNLADVEPERRADVALDEIRSAIGHWHQEHRRPRALNSRDALAAVRFECLLLWTAWHNLLNGVELGDADTERINLAMARVEAICAEAIG